MNLTPVERESLVYLLLYGDDIPVNVSDRIDRHQGSVGRSLKNLVEKGLVEKKGESVYKLTIPGVRVAQQLYEKEDYQF